MGGSIHRNGDRYRVWSSNASQYVTPPMTRAEMAEHLRMTATGRREAMPENIEGRLARADEKGTSALRDTRDATKWETERCDGCGRFHHAFRVDAYGFCAECGEIEHSKAHRPPCVAAQAPAVAQPAVEAVPAHNPDAHAAGLVQINLPLKEAAALTAAIEALRANGGRLLELPPGCEVQLLELRCLP